MHTRNKLAVLASTVMVSTCIVAGAASASAVTTADAASVAGPCGSGYSRVGVYPVPASGARTGTIEVHYSSGSGKNCVLAYGYGANNGKRTYKAVGVSLAGAVGWTAFENGTFKYYAGPVYVKAPGKCIDVYGMIADRGRTVSKVHCG